MVLEIVVEGDHCPPTECCMCDKLQYVKPVYDVKESRPRKVYNINIHGGGKLIIKNIQIGIYSLYPTCLN